MENGHGRHRDTKYVHESALSLRGFNLTNTCDPGDSRTQKSGCLSAFCTPGPVIPLYSRRLQRFQIGNNHCMGTKRKTRLGTALQFRACVESQETQLQLRTSEGVVRRFWELARDGQFVSTLPHFSKDVVYYDVLYTQPFRGKKALEDHFMRMESVIPSSFVFVLDDIAAGTLKVGARWHVENQDGKRIPFTRGASMYTLVEEDGHLVVSEAWDFPETPIKLPGIVLPLLGFAGAVLRFFGGSSTKRST